MHIFPYDRIIKLSKARYKAGDIGGSHNLGLPASRLTLICFTKKMMSKEIHIILMVLFFNSSKMMNFCLTSVHLIIVHHAWPKSARKCNLVKGPHHFHLSLSHCLGIPSCTVWWWSWALVEHDFGCMFISMIKGYCIWRIKNIYVSAAPLHKIHS